MLNVMGIREVYSLLSLNMAIIASSATNLSVIKAARMSFTSSYSDVPCFGFSPMRMMVELRPRLELRDWAVKTSAVGVADDPASPFVKCTSTSAVPVLAVASSDPVSNSSQSTPSYPTSHLGGTVQYEGPWLPAAESAWPAPKRASPRPERAMKESYVGRD